MLWYLLKLLLFPVLLVSIAWIHHRVKRTETSKRQLKVALFLALFWPLNDLFWDFIIK